MWWIVTEKQYRVQYQYRGCCSFTCWCEHVNVIVFALIMDNYSMTWGESLSRSLQACSSVTACWIGLFTDTMMKHLQSMDAARSFSEFRQEASMLHSLQHPCIVALVGISIHPLCFALQLAPLGSLNTILEERAKGDAWELACVCLYLHKTFPNI